MTVWWSELIKREQGRQTLRNTRSRFSTVVLEKNNLKPDVIVHGITLESTLSLTLFWHQIHSVLLQSLVNDFFCNIGRVSIWKESLSLSHRFSYFIRHETMQVAEMDHPKRWSSWLSAAHSLRCFERTNEKNRLEGKTGASGPNSSKSSLTFFV